jgi:biotin operon repressor
LVIEDQSLRYGFVQLPKQVLRASNLTRDAKLLYAVLLGYAWEQDRCFPGYARLCQDMGATEKVVRKYMQELEAIGLVIQKRRGLGKTNLYRLPDLRTAKLEIPEGSKTPVQERYGAEGSKTPVLEQSDAPVAERPNTPVKVETVEQETEITRSFEISKGPQFIFDEDRNAISTVMRDFARELGDTAPLSSTVSRAVNLYRQSGWELDPFLDGLYEARRITQERTGSIKTESPQKLGPKPKVPYFFSVLESLITGNQRREG